MKAVTNVEKAYVTFKKSYNTMGEMNTFIDTLISSMEESGYWLKTQELTHQENNHEVYMVFERINGVKTTYYDEFDNEVKW